MKHVLIVSPTFLPKTSADMHRVRMMLPHLKNAGWRATVLAAEPDEVPGPDDQLLQNTLDAETRIVRYTPLRYARWSKFGLRNLGWRSLPALRKAGQNLLQVGDIDCVLFSNTMFSTWLAGPAWKREHGVPYVLDFQDPWLRFGPRTHAAPGHPLKALAARLIAARYEARVVREATALLTVSPAYRRALQERYPSFPDSHIVHIPFAASQNDIDLLETVQVRNPAFGDDNGFQNYVYVGRLGDDMIPALNGLFRSFSEFVKAFPERAKRIRFHFIGTSYAPASDATLSAVPIAMNWQLLDYVIETPHRIPYMEALQVIKDSDGVLVLGSTDAAYSPSKLFPALLSTKPILCLAAKDSVLSRFITEYQVPALLWDYTYSHVNQLLFERFAELSPPPTNQLPEPLLELARADRMTDRVCALLHAASIQSRTASGADL